MTASLSRTILAIVWNEQPLKAPAVKVSLNATL